MPETINISEDAQAFIRAIDAYEGEFTERQVASLLRMLFSRASRPDDHSITWDDAIEVMDHYDRLCREHLGTGWRQIEASDGRNLAWHHLNTYGGNDTPADPVPAAPFSEYYDIPGHDYFRDAAFYVDAAERLGGIRSNMANVMRALLNALRLHHISLHEFNIAFDHVSDACDDRHGIHWTDLDDGIANLYDRALTERREAVVAAEREDAEPDQTWITVGAGAGGGASTVDFVLDEVPWDEMLVDRNGEPVRARVEAEVEVEESTGAYAYANEARGSERYRYNRAYVPESLRGEGTRFVGIHAGQDDYVSALRHAFDFIRTNADRRYTDRTLMSITRAADRADQLTREEREYDETFPIVFIAEAPFAFDELTEEKKGGTLAVGVQLVNDEGESRAVMAVRANYRRKGLATAFVERMFSHGVSYYMSNRNFPAMTLATKLSLSPIEVRSNGVVRMARPDMLTVPADDYDRPMVAEW